MSRLAARIEPYLSGAVLLREATRSSRQWRLYAGRAAFSATLMGVVLLAIFTATHVPFVDAGAMSGMGRGLFVGFAVIEALLATIAAPAVVARGVIEEREERTLDLVVLTRLRPTPIFVAKIAARLLVLAMVVVGAAPVLAIVTSLGGVSAVEVAAVTAGSLVAMTVMGVLGGFFALFTRSQVLATMAALVWAFVGFGVAPWVYATATLSATAAAHVSPLYGTVAHNAAALLPALYFVPVVARAVGLGARLFGLRVASVSYYRLFSADAWAQSAWLREGLVLLVTAFTGVPIAMVGAWAFAMPGLQGGTPLTTATGDLIGWGVSAGVLWLWGALTTSWLTWIFLRLGAEWIVAIDTMLSPFAGGPARRPRPEPRVPGNPIVWREVRLRQFAGWGFALILYVLVMWGAFQSMIWLVPGGLLGIGILNALLGWVLAVWLATASIEKERRDGTLAVLLTTTMPSGRIVVGKTLAVAAPTLPLVAVGGLLVLLGTPYLQVFVDGSGASAGWGFVRGAFVAMWCGAVWAMLVAMSFVVAVRVGKPRNAYGVNLAITGALLTVPWLIGVSLPNVTALRVITRMLVPLVAVRASWWEPLVSAALAAGVAGALFVALVARLRAWSADAGD